MKDLIRIMEQSLNVINFDGMKVKVRLAGLGRWKGRRRATWLKTCLAEVGSQVMRSRRYGSKNKRLLGRIKILTMVTMHGFYFLSPYLWS